MLSNEERNRLVETFNQFHDAVKTAKIYSVSVGSVYRLVRQMKDTGSVDLKTGSRGRKPVLSPEDIGNIRRTVLEQPDITIHELTVQLNLSAGEETVRTRVAELGLRYKKTLRASEQERSDIQDKRKWRRKWQENMMAPSLHRLVFLDESGVNTNLTRRYGRAFGKERVTDCVPLNKPKNTTILSSMRPDGSVAYTTYSGGTTGEKFIEYLKETLIPTLKPFDIVIMDNLRTRHIQAVQTLLSRAGAMLTYLPAYSPDLNPIEMMRSKVKAILRKAKERTEETLIAAIKEAMKEITPEDCQGWFRKAGYR